MTQVAVFTDSRTNANQYTIQNAINTFLQNYPQASNVKINFCTESPLFTVIVTIETESAVPGI